MVSTDLKHIRLFVCLLATLLVGLVAMALLVMGMMSLSSFLFLVSGYILMSLHWFLLVWLVSGLFSGARAAILVRGLLAAVPVCLSLVLVFMAIRRVPQSVVAAIVGVFTVPVAATVYALWYGLKTFVLQQPAKGVAHE